MLKASAIATSTLRGTGSTGSVTYVPRIPPVGRGAFTFGAGGVVYRHPDNPGIIVVIDLARDWSRKHCRTEHEARLLATRRWPRERWVTSDLTGHMLEYHRRLGETAARGPA